VDVTAFKSLYQTAISLQIDTLLDTPATGTAAVTMVFSLNAGAVRTLTVEFVPYGQEFYAVIKHGKGDMLVNRQQVNFMLKSLEDLAAATKG
jgi:hypothetical protein